MSPLINTELLLSDAQGFDDAKAINPFMDSSVPIDVQKAQTEHDTIRAAFEAAGAKITQVPSPKNCQDGIYTANWALVLNGTALMARLPNARRGEEAYAQKTYHDLGIKTILPPEGMLFSGQGDMLYIPGTNLVIGGHGYRTDQAMHQVVEEIFGVRVISLHSIPQRSFFGYKNLRFGKPVINKYSGLADSPAYDIDLCVGVLRGKTADKNPLIAYCPDLLDTPSQKLMSELEGIDKIIVSRSEALRAFACNLVSTGETAVINKGAVRLIQAVEAEGIHVIPLANDEISKGGGGFRCVSNTLNNITPR